MIRRMAVLGAGIMGSEIAQTAAAGGVEVVLFDAVPAALEQGMAHVASIGERRVARGRMSEEEARAVLGRVTTATEDAALADCDLAIEAVPEVMDIKRQVFRRLDAALPPHALLATNTSACRSARWPPRRAGRSRWWASTLQSGERDEAGGGDPRHRHQRGHDVGGRDAGVVARQGAGPGARVPGVPGEPGAGARPVGRLPARGRAGADMAAADAATVAAGPAPMGPFALGDLIGLDTLGHIQRDLQAAYGDRFADAGAVAAQVDAGRLGAKTGAGFYDGKAPEAEPDEAGRHVAEAYYASALDEARRCIDEDVAARRR